MNWKTPITLSVLVVIVVGAAYYGWRAVVAPPADGGANTAPGVTATTPACEKVTEVRKGKRVDSKDVLINVYNAGSIAGLATETLATLAGKGFRVGVAADAPVGTTATNVTILAKNRRDPKVRLVAQQFNGKVAVSKNNLGPGIDIAVGDQFKSVDPAAKRFFVEKRTVTRCEPATTSAS